MFLAQKYPQDSNMPLSSSRIYKTQKSAIKNNAIPFSRFSAIKVEKDIFLDIYYVHSPQLGLQQLFRFFISQKFSFYNHL